MAELAWTLSDLPEELRNLPEPENKIAKAIYNGRVLAEAEGDPVQETLAELKRRGRLSHG